MLEKGVDYSSSAWSHFRVGKIDLAGDFQMK